MDTTSELGCLGAALHAARRALEPGLPPRAALPYLLLNQDVLPPETGSVRIDIDEFRHLAELALRQEEISAYETALAAYSGERCPALVRLIPSLATEGQLVPLPVSQALLSKGALDEALVEHVDGLSLGNLLYAEELTWAMRGRDEIRISEGR